MKDSINNLGS